ncbi:FKBP-type peptidyl-prolyl cis-trans isomerase [Marinoscillum sp. 108]|jgi:FKBP-type peptidyl-prolyl cis-trans isomerase|uniref:FKBP-type peptidyl-prolyl cis-trans isomerase n=1 Tax=Marinoscillum sp. 108 TaxID=2653151 RepID=UPI0012F2467C|nr:FKBP-type peptidyl-prolyl cis-trans isomerase [Marinoscillum sp. 108]VXD11746.1 Peptidyl-prolyl cis-trans isomerase [Marinoscillum sp. 108]
MTLSRLKPVLLGLSIILLAFTTSCLKSDDVFDSAAQYTKDQEIISQYIADNGLTVQTDTSGHGLKYTMVKEGTGDSPKLNDILFLNYKGTLLSNGKVFDEQDSAFLQLSPNLIGGWQVLVPYLKEGGGMTMYLPSFYGYGHYGSGDGSIPADAILIFNIELHGIFTQFEFEQYQIERYLENNDLTAMTDTVKGLKYIITKEGTGDHPVPSDKIKVDYSGRLLANDEEFEKNENIEYTLSSLIEGWEILMPYVKEGGSITMFIPSKYAYGTNSVVRNGVVKIPPNSTLIFEVTLNRIVD